MDQVTCDPHAEGRQHPADNRQGKGHSQRPPGEGAPQGLLVFHAENAPQSAEQEDISEKLRWQQLDHFDRRVQMEERESALDQQLCRQHAGYRETRKEQHIAVLPERIPLRGWWGGRLRLSWFHPRNRLLILRHPSLSISAAASRGMVNS